MSSTLVFLVALLVIVNVAVTLAVCRSQKYEQRQKFGQVALIWLLPVVGSLVSFSFLSEGGGERVTTDLADRGGSGDSDRSASSASDYGGGDSGGSGDGE